MTDRSGLHVGRLVLTGVLALAFILAGFVFVDQSRALAAIKRYSGQHQFARLTAPENRNKVETPDRADLKTALVAAPLSPAVVNAAVFEEASRKATGPLPTAKLGLLRKLGWRSTVALQNIVFLAVQTRNLGLIADVGDALLRRQEIEEEATALMRLMELAPETRKILVTKLAEDPVWRFPYFRLGGIEGRQQAKARGQLVEELTAVGSPLSRAEIYSTLKMLVDAREVPIAYRLWLDYRKIKPQPLGDAEFEWAYATRSDADLGMPFEWVLPSGPGYWSEVIRQDGGRAAIAINWDGKGTPLLLAQQTALPSAAYRLVLAGDDVPANILSTFAFALRCPGGRAIFDTVASQTRTRLVATTPDDVKCDSPVFEVTGRPKAGLAAQALGQSGIATSYNIVLDRIEIR